MDPPFKISKNLDLSYHVKNVGLIRTKYLNQPCVIPLKDGAPLQNNPKNLDLSYKTDLDFWVCFWKDKALYYSQSNMVIIIKYMSTCIWNFAAALTLFWCNN